MTSLQNVLDSLNDMLKEMKKDRELMVVRFSELETKLEQMNKDMCSLLETAPNIVYKKDLSTTSREEFWKCYNEYPQKLPGQRTTKNLPPKDIKYDDTSFFAFNAFK